MGSVASIASGDAISVASDGQRGVPMGEMRTPTPHAICKFGFVVSGGLPRTNHNYGKTEGKSKMRPLVFRAMKKALARLYIPSRCILRGWGGGGDPPYRILRAFYIGAGGDIF